MTVCLNLYPFDHAHIENISERNGVIAAKKHTSVIVISGPVQSMTAKVGPARKFKCTPVAVHPPMN